MQSYHGKKKVYFPQMLGYKKLETNILELQYVYVGKPWSKCLI